MEVALMLAPVGAAAFIRVEPLIPPPTTVSGQGPGLNTVKGTLMSIPGARGGKWNRGGRREVAMAGVEVVVVVAVAVGLKGARLAAAAAKKEWGRGGVWV